MRLEDLQRELAVSLAGRGPAPAGLDEAALERTRRSLESKRRRAAEHLLPRLQAILGGSWKDRFHEHAARYAPGGLLPHIDDAWEFARNLARTGEPGIRLAARADLAPLRLRYVRRPKEGACRIRERRGFLLLWLSAPAPTLLLRLPGSSGRTWRIRLPL